MDVLTADDIRMINRWTSHADVPIERLLMFQEKIKAIEPVAELVVYRGIGAGLSYQDKMGLYDKKFFMHFLQRNVTKGHVFTYNTPRPASFTDDIRTARAFGRTIVSTILPATSRYIRITEALWEAANRISASSLFQEVILLEVNKDIQCTVRET
jgi:hypothetical protein